MLEATPSSLQSMSSSATSAKTSPTSLPLYYFTQITYNRSHSASLVDHYHKRVRVLGNCDVYIVGEHLPHALVCLCELRLRYQRGKFLLADQQLWTALHHYINSQCFFDIRFLYSNNFIIHSLHIYNLNRYSHFWLRQWNSSSFLYALLWPFILSPSSSDFKLAKTSASLTTFVPFALFSTTHSHQTQNSSRNTTSTRNLLFKHRHQKQVTPRWVSRIMDLPTLRHLPLLLQKLSNHSRLPLLRIRRRTKSQRLHQQLRWRRLLEIIGKPSQNRWKLHSRYRKRKLRRNANHAHVNSWNQWIHMCVRLINIFCVGFDRACICAVQNGKETPAQ